jgi:hypothetical protein
MIYRSYCCLNRRCAHEYTSTDDHPPCPRCGGLRVKWLPKPFSIASGRTADIDATVAGLVEQAGITNYNTPVRGQPVMQRTGPTGAPVDNLQFAPKAMPGWGVNLPAQCLHGQGQAYCAPTGVTAKLKNAEYQFVDKAVPASKSLGAASQIEGSYRPKGGIPQE